MHKSARGEFVFAFPGNAGAFCEFAETMLRNNVRFALVAQWPVWPLGIGAATAIFSIVHGVLLQPLPYSDSRNFRSPNFPPYQAAGCTRLWALPPEFRELQKPSEPSSHAPHHAELFQVSRFDPETFAAPAACVIPARRATAVDQMRALRYEQRLIRLPRPAA